MKLLRMRMRIVEEIRRYMAARGYLEVETPMMQPVAGGAAAKPFVTHHNALDMDLYLRIAPELYLKRLLVGGFTKVFELNRNFRNEGISPRHNPEFTMLEAYEAFGSWQTMAELVEDLICTVAQNVLGTLRIVHRAGEGAQEKVIDLSRRPWRRAGMVDLVSQETGWRFDGRRIQEAAPQVWEKLREHGARDVVLAWTAFEQLAEAYEKLVEPTLIDPCFVTHLPSVLIPLARESREHPGFADVYELAINGQEISPGYSELNDPDVQAHHFQHQVGEDQQKMDDDFVTALKHGMPPAGGMGLGVDRLVMMLTGAPSIRDVILFPLMRPT
jgi:lysyl-tRNA synthetase class 2